MKKITITGKVYSAAIDQEHPGFRLDEKTFNSSELIDPRHITFNIDSYEGLKVKVEPTRVKPIREGEITIVLFVKKKGEQ